MIEVFIFISGLTVGLLIMYGAPRPNLNKHLKSTQKMTDVLIESNISRITADKQTHKMKRDAWADYLSTLTFVKDRIGKTITQKECDEWVESLKLIKYR